MDGVDLRWLAPASSGESVLRREPSLRRVDWLEALRSPHAVALAAAFTVAFLLLAFHHVVADAVKEGELRRRALAEMLDSEWRCKSLRGRSARSDCLDQLRPALGDAPAPRNNIVSSGPVRLVRQ